MSTTFTVDDLRRVLSQGAGLDRSVDLSSTLDDDFERLGVDSLAMLETAARIGREFRVSLDESQIANTMTVREFVESVNRSLAQAA